MEGMNNEEIKSRIATLESRIERDHFCHEKRTFVPATGSTLEWILDSIEALKAELPRAEHDAQVDRHGFKFVEQSV